MQFRKLRGRGGGSKNPDEEVVINIPKDWIEIEGLVDQMGQVGGKETGMMYDPIQGKIEIYLDPEDVVGEDQERTPIVADGAGSDG